MIGNNVVLLNRKSTTLNKSYWNQFVDWVKNTELKTSNEVSSIKIRNMRNLCRVSDITFSIVMLGILLPIYNRKVTEQKVAEAQRIEQQQKTAMKDCSSIRNKDVPNIFKNFA